MTLQERKPSSASRAAIAADSVGCVTKARRAPALKLPASAMATKYLICLKSIHREYLWLDIGAIGIA
jgi:hypothetical protein